jgi:FkbM family methyltransferase
MLMSLSDSSTDVLVALMDPPLTIIDIGARGGLDAAWTPLLPHLRAYGFEADPEESERLAGEHGSLQVKFVPLALGAAPGAVDLHVATDPACSSLYAPDELLPGRYRALAEIAATGRRSITVDTLDRWAEREGVTDVSYLKLDTQGSELDILRGASRTLRTVCAVRTEVEFNPIYENQPLFADVDTFLREQGFVLWRLTNLCHYTLGGHDEGYPFPDRQMFAARRATAPPSSSSGAEAGCSGPTPTSSGKISLKGGGPPTRALRRVRRVFFRRSGFTTSRTSVGSPHGTHRDAPRRVSELRSLAFSFPLLGS